MIDGKSVAAEKGSCKGKDGCKGKEGKK